MNPDLKAIEAALLGEPCDPSNLSPEVASVILPLARRVARESNELREALEEEGRKSEERRLALLAECLDPEGGADLGFTPIMGKWFKPDGERDEFGLWPRWWIVCRDSATANVTLELREHGRYVTASFFVTQRSAMKSTIHHTMEKA